jgi:hypothetical protein
MKYFPATCIDNFYSEPDKIREFALSLEFKKDFEGRWPGSRTKEMHLVDRDFFEAFCNKVFSLFFDLEQTHLTWSVRTMFQLIDSYSDDPLSPKNKGWIHYDDHAVFAGIIFLNPDSDLGTGTSLYKMVDDKNLNRDTTKSKFYLEGIDDNYDESIIKHNECFVETVRFNNIYNRLIAFDGKTAHGANSLYSKGTPRLTQVFFVYDFESSVPPPIIRQKKFL